MSRLILGNYFADPVAGRPITSAKIFIGEPDKDPEIFPIDVYGLQENGDTVLLPQPIRTGAGGTPIFNGSSIVVLVDLATYSIKVKDAYDSQRFYFPVIDDSTEPLVVDDVSELPALVGKVCIVSDSERGGVFEYNENLLAVNDGGVVFNGWVRQYNNAVSIKWFGAVGDGVADDTSSISLAFEYSFKNGANLYIDECSSFYRITSSISLNRQGSSTFQGPAVAVTGCGERSAIKLDSASVIQSMFSMGESVNKVSFNNVWLNADGNANRCLDTNDNYCPFWTFNDCYFRDAIEYQLYFQTYVSTFKNVICFGGEHGFFVGGVGVGPATSVNMISCYANNNSLTGFDFGFVTYCTVSSCACDDTDIAYTFQNAYGVTMSACGAERINKYLYVKTYRGLTISSGYMLNFGSDVVSSPVDYIIELKEGRNATISGMEFSNVRQGGYDYKLGLTSDAEGNNTCNILDDCIRREESYSVGTFRYPLGEGLAGYFFDRNTKDRDVPKDPSSDLDFDEFLFLNERATTTVTLAAGTHTIKSGGASIKGVSGSGSIIIQGATSDPSLYVITQTFKEFSIENCSANIVFKNCTITASTTSSFNNFVDIINSNVTFDNVVFLASVNSGSAFTATLGSHVSLINGTTLNGGELWKGFQGDATNYVLATGSSKIYYDPQSSFPTSGAYSRGAEIKDATPSTGGHIGWVCTSSGTSGGTWKTYGVIS